jgi:hypothetical protein
MNSNHIKLDAKQDYKTELEKNSVALWLNNRGIEFTE